MEMEEVNLNATEHAFGDELVLNQAAFQIDVEIQGFNSGLMLDKYDVASNGDKTGATKTRAQPPKDEAEARLYMSLTGSKKPVIPTVNLMRCLIDAGRQVKVGKRQLSTKSDTLIPGFFVINEPELVIKSNQGWYPNSMGVGVVGGRKIKVRPCFPDWGLKFGLACFWQQIARDRAESE